MGREAEELIQKAEALSNPKKKWGLFTPSPDYYEAAELYNKAAIIYKGLKEWQEAGDAFIKSSELDSKAGEPDILGRKLLNAASCYKKCNIALAAQTTETAVAILLQEGRFSSAAIHEKEIADMYETVLEDFTNAIKFYERAAEHYFAEDQNGNAQSCLVKAAQLCALAGDYDRAARMFEEAASSCSSDAYKYQVPDYLVRAGLSRLLAEDRVAARRAIEGFPLTSVSFGNSKEYAALEALLKALEDNDVEEVSNAAAGLDRIRKLDDWMTKMLLRIKDTIDEEPDLT